MESNRSTQLELVAHTRQPAAGSAEVEALHDDTSNSAEGFSLPPTDGGKNAWMCLFSCFMLEAMIWGQLT
jgi:hypothetical protein